jgi:hypothetical protein
MNIASRLSADNEILQVDLALADFASEQFVQTVCDRASGLAIFGCIVNVSEIDFFLQTDIAALTKLVSALELCGYRVLVCGFDPLCAALIYSYVDVLPFSTELNSRHAVKALQGHS